MAGQINADVKSRFRLLAPYWALKNGAQKRLGITFGLDYNALAQDATASLGEDDAAGGAFRVFGTWALVSPDSPFAGNLVFKVENRHALGTDVTPSQFGREIGYAGQTNISLRDAGWLLTNLYWHQRLFGQRLAVVFGIVDTTDYVDVYRLANPWTDFSNLAFMNGPTIASPGQGLGAAVGGLLSEHVYVVGGLADANGDPSRQQDSFDSFFHDAEFFTHAELGWISSFERRFDDNAHLTAWHADARTGAGTPDGWGLAFSASQLFDETWEPFVRAGYADEGGAPWQWSASAGLGLQVGEFDFVGLGLNWGRPAESVFGPGLDDQYTAELYYRLQLTSLMAITPDVQLLVNPALNPGRDVIAVFGTRARIAF